MTKREAFINALERRAPSGRVPTFELGFCLTMEVFGKVHPRNRIYGQWDQMSEKERQLHRRDIAQLYIDIARRFEHNAIVMTPNPMTAEETVRLAEIIREISGNEYFLLVPGDATYGIPTGEAMMEFSCRLLDEPEKLKDEARKKLDTLTAYLESIAECKLIDGLVMCTDYCFNDNSFLSPAQFDEFVTPYLADQIKVCRDLGLYTIKHTDGNIMPILDSMVEANPHALHSLDPQGGIDMAEIKRLVGNKVCLVGNVNCGLMDTGTLEEALASASYALKHGMPGGGYIFSTSNCVYPGMSLERYEAILGVWQREGNYT